MELRIGALIVLVDQDGDIQRINQIISEHSDLILGRQGMHLRKEELPSGIRVFDKINTLLDSV